MNLLASCGLSALMSARCACHDHSLSDMHVVHHHQQQQQRFLVAFMHSFPSDSLGTTLPPQCLPLASSPCSSSMHLPASCGLSARRLPGAHALAILSRTRNTILWQILLCPCDCGLVTLCRTHLLGTQTTGFIPNVCLEKPGFRSPVLDMQWHIQSVFGTC
jgi:hypothetical protein